MSGSPQGWEMVMLIEKRLGAVESDRSGLEFQLCYS